MEREDFQTSFDSLAPTCPGPEECQCRKNGYKLILQELHDSGFSSLRAVIIYDNFVSAVQAASALLRIAASLRVNAGWHIEPWRLDMLKFPPTADKALDEAERAHLVLITNLATSSVPIWLKHGLERWASLRQIRHAALAVMHDKTSRDLSTRLAVELSELAAQGGLGFIWNLEITQQNGSTGLCRTAAKRLPSVYA
jgi:hypothetical protein